MFHFVILFVASLGDMTTAQFLISGISTALFQRLTTEKGSKVENSVLHAGAWCMSPHILNTKLKALARDDVWKQTKQTVDALYMTKDNHLIALSYKGSFNQLDDCIKELRALLKVPPELEFNVESTIKEMSKFDVTNALNRGKKVFMHEVVQL